MSCSREGYLYGSAASLVNSPRVGTGKRPMVSERWLGVKKGHRLSDCEGLLSVSDATYKND